MSSWVPHSICTRTFLIFMYSMSACARVYQDLCYVLYISMRTCVCMCVHDQFYTYSLCIAMSMLVMKCHMICCKAMPCHAVLCYVMHAMDVLMCQCDNALWTAMTAMMHVGVQALMGIQQLIQGFLVLREGLSTGLWGLQCPIHCSGSSLPSLLLALLSGLILGFILCLILGFWILTSTRFASSSVDFCRAQAHSTSARAKQRLAGYLPSYE